MKIKLVAILFVCLFTNVCGQKHAIDSLEGLLSIELKADTLRVNRLNELALYIESTDLNKIWKYVNEADSISEQIKYKKGKAESMALKGLYFRYKNNIDSSFWYNKVALEMYGEQKDSLNIARIHSFMAVLHSLQHNFDSAMVYNDSAQAVFLKKDDKDLMASAYFDMGRFNNQVGYYAKALENYQKAIEIYEKKNYHLKLAQIYNHMSSVYKTYRRYDKSFELMYKTIAIYDSLNNRRGLINAYFYLAIIYSSTGNNDTALYIWDKGLAIAKELNYTKRIIDLQNQAGIIYYTHKHDTIKAKRYLMDALKESKKSQYKMGIHISTKNLAKIHMREGNLYRAKIYAIESLDYAKQIKIFKNLVNANYVLSEIYKRDNDYKNAYTYFLNYKSYYDSVFNDVTKNKIANLENNYQYEKKKHKLELEQQRKDAENKAMLEKEKRNRQLVSLMALVVVIITLALTMIYRVRQKQKRSQLAQTKAEIENRLLRVQMNPHFMFNSLNSVQSYIASNQNELAEDYLARFAQLTRAILNNSRQDFITLDNEIETLKTYLELEQQRFNQAFEFSINIDEELDEEMLQVPPMLIQPFVENAIIHGVAPLKGGGEIKLNFSLSENEKSIQCTVTDNGIGRNESAKINKGSKHKSLGLQVTKERFKLIKHQTNVPVTVNILDINENGKTGTKVELIIPFIED